MCRNSKKNPIKMQEGMVIDEPSFDDTLTVITEMRDNPQPPWDFRKSLRKGKGNRG
jgi:hypothetical protein